MDKKNNIRKRGDTLIEHIFNSTMQLIDTINPISLTFQQIANASKTSRTVLYRRWPNTFALLEELYIHKAQKFFTGEFFNTMHYTGNLRADFIQLLSIYQDVYNEVGVKILNNYYYLKMQDINNNKEHEIHYSILNKHILVVKEILKNSKIKGQKVNKVNGITLMLPFDIIRIENIVRLGNVDIKRIKIIVDEILLPVFKASN